MIKIGYNIFTFQIHISMKFLICEQYIISTIVHLIWLKLDIE